MGNDGFVCDPEFVDRVGMFHLYGFIIGVAATLWWSIVEKIEPRAKKVIVPILVISVVGARLYHVVDYWQYYQVNLSQIPMMWLGGMSIWGALIAGLLALLWLDKEIVWAVVTPLPLAQAVGRVANGVNHEFTNPIFGIPWWASEAILDLILFAVVWNCPKKWRVLVYLVGYLGIRLVLLPYR